MNFTKSLLTIGIASTLLFSCKDTSSKPAAGNADAKANKKEVAALKPETATFKVDGMTCAIGCARTIQEKLSKMNGVQKATVDFDKKQATVEYDAAVLTPEKLKKAIETTGDGETYKATMN